MEEPREKQFHNNFTHDVGKDSTPDGSEQFYRISGSSYANFNEQFLAYVESSHPRLNSDLDLHRRLKELVGNDGVGLDAGCGAGARDVHLMWQAGYKIIGLDSVIENILLAKVQAPEIAGHLLVHDLRQPLPFANATYTFAACNFVIQHIPPHSVRSVVLPELARILKPGGILQIVFKRGAGLKIVYDELYHSPFGHFGAPFLN